MLSKGAFAVIKKNKNEVLLVKRKDIPFWDLPGGRVEVDEKIDDCVIRETFEETGLIVEVDYLVGTYKQKHRHDEQYIYSVKVLSGKMIENGPETKEIKYFSTNKLPINLIPLRKRQIRDLFEKKKKIMLSLTKIA